MSSDGFVHQAWEQMDAHYPSDARLAADPVYALSVGLIKELQKERLLLDQADLEFERRLAEACGEGGFLAGHPFPEPFSMRSPVPAAEQEECVTGEVDPHRGLFDPYPWSPPVGVDWPEQHEFTAKRQRAYVAWLVCSPEFRRERDAIHKSLGDQVAGPLGFPRETSSAASGLPPYNCPTGHFLQFCRHWGLQTFATWELPVPASVEFRGCTPGVSINVSGPGVSIFLPWYFLKDKQFSLPKVTERLLGSEGFRHLSGWLDPQNANPLGYDRLGHHYTLYRYWVLGLSRRYEGQLKGKTERLDQAFARYQSVGPDTIKKARHSLFTALDAAEPNVDSTS
jgi:hypothetical protein